MYKAIIFDIDNTLLNYSSSELLSMQETMKSHGFFEKEDFVWDYFWSHFNEANLGYWNDRIKKGFNIQQVLEYSFRDTLIKLKEEHIISKSMAATYWNLFCTTCHFEEGAAEILAHLHGQFKLGVISNGIGEAQRSRLLKGEIDHYFDTLVISDEVGYWKPEKEIFHTALDRLGVQTHEVLFVGDSITDDYQGSLRAGIDFCLYNRGKQRLDAGINPKFIVESLGDIKQFI